jgi:hypothetical protein
MHELSQERFWSPDSSLGRQVIHRLRFAASDLAGRQLLIQKAFVAAHAKNLM